MGEERSSRAPWYGFLYRFLGAHGTFWLWVLSVVAMWWTWQGALVRLLDREPERRTVAEISQASDFHRWVALYGVEVLVDGALLGRDASAPDPGPVPILIDAGDPAARFWLQVRADAFVHAAPTPKVDATAAALGDSTALGEQLRRLRTEAEDRLLSARTAVQTDPKNALPRPDGAILLLRASRPVLEEIGPPGAVIGSATVSAVPSAAPTTAPREDASSPYLTSYLQSVYDWAERVRVRVHPSDTTGLLDTAPRSILERLEKDPGIRLAASGLQVDRRPRDAELYVFCVALLVMVFLAAGFYGRPALKSP